MSIKTIQEINNIRNGVKNLNIVTTDNTRAILDEATLARANENNIFSALLVEKNRAQNAEATNEQAIFSEAMRAAAAEAANAQEILDETTRANNAEVLLGQRITTEIADEVIRASGEEAAISLLILSETTRASNIEGGIISSVTSTINALDSAKIHYGFRVTSSFGLQNMSANDTCYFNYIDTSIGCYCVPNINAFETANYRYIIPIDGYYVLGYKLYINGSPASGVSFGIYVNNVLKIQSGQVAAMGETMQFNIYCIQGDNVIIKCSSGNGAVEMQTRISQFYGYRIGF